MGTRDEFSLETKRVIAARVGYRCSHPDCGALTVGPTADPTKRYNIGAACHIAAAAEGGPRYDPTMTPEQRKHPDNGIWMCRTHADEVDDDASKFTVDLLRKWKKEAEARTQRMLGKAVKLDTRPLHFADVSTAERYGINAQVELENGTKLPFASTFDVERDDIAFFATTALVIRFLIVKAESVKSIMLYQIQATVFEYEPLPAKYKKFMYAYPQTVYPYILQLEKAIDGRLRPCLASLFCPPGEEKPVPFTPLVITEDMPQVIDVRFTAPTSGIYTFALDAVITSGVDKHTFRILNPTPVLFEKFEEVCPD
jgi:hypothetical protein